MINYISKPFKWFFKLEAASGLILLFAATIALIISNSDFSDLYFETLNKYLFIGINNIGIKLSVIHWINDALMAIFFSLLPLKSKENLFKVNSQILNKQYYQLLVRLVVCWFLLYFMFILIGEITLH